MCVSRPVGLPPLKILAGLTSPKPAPCAKSPAGRPRTGTAAGDVLATGDVAAAGAELLHAAQVSAAPAVRARPAARRPRRATAGSARRSLVIMVALRYLLPLLPFPYDAAPRRQVAP